MIHGGLVSVTFRKLTPLQVVRLVSQTGLKYIEWGGDVHVPAGDVAAARQVAQMTSDAGLSVAAYGSYYRVSEANGGSFEEVVAAASALEAPTIRVWAGKRGSAEADSRYRAHVIEDSCRIADLAQSAGMSISFEYHGRTLTDVNDSAIALLREVDHPGARCYWQPPVDATAEYCLEGLRQILPWLTNLHVFQWQPGEIRHPLQEGEDRWLRYLGAAMSAGGDRAAMIEFVKDDQPDSFLQDAATLSRWLSGLQRPC